MKTRLKSGIGCFGNNKGFTLIEMAVVLIIIGIIIGAVVKGKDLVRGADQKKNYTSWVREWQLAFDNYYDRTGWVLGDDASDNNANRDGQCDDTATNTNLENQLRAVGLGAPAGGATGSSLVRTYTDCLGVQRTLTLAFDHKASLGNFLRIAGIPNDLGIAWDRIVDDEVDGQNGDFVYTADHTPASPSLGAWPSAQTAPASNAAGILRLQF